MGYALSFLRKESCKEKLVMGCAEFERRGQDGGGEMLFSVECVRVSVLSFAAFLSS